MFWQYVLFTYLVIAVGYSLWILQSAIRKDSNTRKAYPHNPNVAIFFISLFSGLFWPLVYTYVVISYRRERKDK